MRSVFSLLGGDRAACSHAVVHKWYRLAADQGTAGAQSIGDAEPKLRRLGRLVVITR